MPRIFTDRTKRTIISLDGMWFFKTDSDNSGKSQNFQKGFTDGAEIAIPSVWNTEFGLAEYKGAVWYSKNFYFEGGNLRLIFEAGMTRARGFNNKGIVNEYRKPKHSYFEVKKLYNNFKGE